MSSIFDGIGDDSIEKLDENLRKWFKEKWVRFGPDGKIRGACARGDDSEGKPKCLPQKKAQALGKKGRKYAASKKRREDPNPERRGPAKNVATKKKTNEGVPFNQCPECGGEIVHESMMNEKQDACYHKVKSRYKVWPSAYASGALVQCRKKGASNWGTGGKKNESNIMKGLVAENEMVHVIYVDGHPLTKYVDKTRANTDAEQVKKRFPNKNVEVKHEMHEAANPAQQAAIAINMKKKGEKPKNEGVIIGHDKDDPEVAILGGAGTYKLSNVKKKAQMEANELAKDVMNGKYKNSAYNVKQLANTLNTIVAAEDEMEKLYFGEDSSMEFAAEKTPAINPYGGLKDRQFRGAIGEALLSEMPTDNPTGASGEGGWRTYKPKPAGEIDEAKKSEFRLQAEEEQYAKLEKINNSTLPHWAKEYLTLLNDPKGKVFKAAYYSFPKGQDARKEAAEYIMQKYKIPQEWIDKIDRLRGSHVTMNRPEDRHYNWDIPSMHEDTAYAGGMGQGGNAGQSYRKFKPKSAGTFKEDELDEACWKGYHKEGDKKMFGKTYPNCVKNTNEEEQLDEKCWDSHKQVGMKNKGGKSVPNCVPKESAIMKGLTGKRR